VVDREPLIVLMPSDHHLASREAIHPRELLGEIFIGGSNEASVLHAVTEDYLRRYGLDIKLAHGVDNLAMAMSLDPARVGISELEIDRFARNKRIQFERITERVRRPLLPARPKCSHQRLHPPPSRPGKSASPRGTSTI
jgi:LysR substrate binding domain